MLLKFKKFSPLHDFKLLIRYPLHPILRTLLLCFLVGSLLSVSFAFPFSNTKEFAVQ